jgi:hypothetical protein
MPQLHLGAGIGRSEIVTAAGGGRPAIASFRVGAWRGDLSQALGIHEAGRMFVRRGGLMPSESRIAPHYGGAQKNPALVECGVKDPAITCFRTFRHYHRPGKLNGRVRNGNACDLPGMFTGIRRSGGQA